MKVKGVVFGFRCSVCGWEGSLDEWELEKNFKAFAIAKCPVCSSEIRQEVSEKLYDIVAKRARKEETEEERREKEKRRERLWELYRRAQWTTRIGEIL